MDALPEELLAQVISYIHNHSPADAIHPAPDTATLHAVCLTSRKLSRIATPYLYHSIHSRSGGMGLALQRVLTSDTTGVLRRHVRQLAVQHTTQGCFKVSQAYRFDDEEYGHTYDVCQLTFYRTACLLPSLETLDLSRLPLADEGKGTWLGALSGRYAVDGMAWCRRTGFEHVKRMALHLGNMGVEDIWVVFRLPELKELELDVRTRARENAWQQRYHAAEKWEIGTSGVEVLRLIGLSNRCGRLGTLGFMSEACTALKSLFVAVEYLHILEMIPYQFHPHVCSGVLKSMQIAVVGLWHYDMELLSVEKEYDLNRLGIELGNLMMHVTGNYDENREEVFESEHIRIAKIRELTESEKKNYDLRLARRP